MATQDAPAPVQAGDVFAGKYVVERVVGSGAMGVVAVARHSQLGEKVALKFLRAEVALRPDLLARFLREARSAVRIKSEHVARIFDVGTTDGGLPYIVMEFLEGLDLQQILQTRGALPVAEAVEFVTQSCLAMAEAHATGIIHRDLKPSNLFLTRRSDGSPLVKVLDFGISKVIADATDRTDLTATNGILGSPLYISPEQARSARSVDARADVWSLGVILHTLVTGEPPFAGDSIAEVLSAILFAPPKRLTEARPDAPADLEAVVLKCLVKEVDLRTASVVELAVGLAPWAQAESRAAVARIACTPSLAPCATPESMPPAASANSPVKTLTADVPVRTMTGWTASESRPTQRLVVRALAIGGGLLLAAIGSFALVRHHGSGPATPAAASAGTSAAAAPADPLSPGEPTHDDTPPAPVVVAPVHLDEPAASRPDPATAKPADSPPETTRRSATQDAGPRPNGANATRPADAPARSIRPAKPAATRGPATAPAAQPGAPPAAAPIDPGNLPFDLGSSSAGRGPRR